MTVLSVNLNKVALIRNSRPTTIPDLLKIADISIEAGAKGITVHPRQDQRHIRPHDVTDLKQLLTDKHPKIELNVEGNPLAGPRDSYPGFMEIIYKSKPQQVTLVPDTPSQLTSDHGWMVKESLSILKDVIQECHHLGCRTSLFIDYDTQEFDAIAETGTDRVEIYTEPFARAYEDSAENPVLSKTLTCVKTLSSMGIGINAGHDLNLDNLGPFSNYLGKTIDEVSIGHALTCDALIYGWKSAVKRYLALLPDS